MSTTSNSMEHCVLLGASKGIGFALARKLAAQGRGNIQELLSECG